MKKLLLILFLFTKSVSAEPQSMLYDYPIVRVVDGDTVVFKADFLPKPLKAELALRIYGVDTPEKGSKAKCALENEKSKRATQFTTELIANSQKRQILLMHWDKYGGRVLGDIILDGKSLREMLIQRGLARPYFGESKKSWC